MSNELLKIFIFVTAACLLAGFLLLLILIISQNKVNYELMSVYECGFQPFGETNYPFEVQFSIMELYSCYSISKFYIYSLFYNLSLNLIV